MFGRKFEFNADVVKDLDEKEVCHLTNQICNFDLWVCNIPFYLRKYYIERN